MDIQPLLRALQTTTSFLPIHHRIQLATRFLTITMTRRRAPFIPAAAPLRAWRDLCRLVLTAGYPFHLFLATPIHRIQLRTLAGRRRSYPCRVDTPRRASENPRRRSASASAGRPGTSIPRGRIAKRARRPSPAFPAELVGTEPAGLHNPHNFCYRRAVLQCLLHVPALHAHFARTHRTCDGGRAGACVACALREFFRAYWHDRRDGEEEEEEEEFPAGAVGRLDAALRASYVPGEGEGAREILRTTRQCDAHEFLMLLLNKLEAQAGET